MTESLDLSLYAKPMADGTLGMELAVEGIACGGCIGRIEHAVKSVPGVTEARLNFTNRRLHVAWSPGLAEPAAILRALEDGGYHGHPFVPMRVEQQEAAEARRLTRCLAVAGFAAMNIMLLSVSVWSGNVTDITPETRDFFHWASALIADGKVYFASRRGELSIFAHSREKKLLTTVDLKDPISMTPVAANGVLYVGTMRQLFALKQNAPPRELR